MLIHLVPKVFNTNPDISVELVDFTIPEFGLTLKPGVDIKIGRPYPNKLYQVVSRKIGKKDIVGLLVSVDFDVSAFTSITRWLVDGDAVDHVVNFSVIDKDFDFISVDPLIWNSGDGLGSRWPAQCQLPTPEGVGL